MYSYFLCSQLCKPGSLDPKKVKGKILVCYNYLTPRTEKGAVAALAGAVGMILTNIFNGDEFADAHVLPVSHVDLNDTISVLDYINSTKY